MKTAPALDSTWRALADEFPPELERTYQGRGGRSFTYIEPRDVMERLDTVLTPSGWQFKASAVNDQVAHGSLSIKVGDEWITREDFGYPNNNADIAESLKEAQSDALRRCAMMFGVARYLYRRDTPHAVPQRPSAPTPIRPAPTTSAGGDEPPWPADEIKSVELVPDESTCPVHHKAWRTNSKGYYCASKVGDGWCQRKPSAAWAASQELVTAG